MIFIPYRSRTNCDSGGNVDDVLAAAISHQEKYAIYLLDGAFSRQGAVLRCNVEEGRAGFVFLRLVEHQPERARAIRKDTGIDARRNR